MAYFRRPKDHKNPYAQISNAMLEDDRLSFKAKGLFSYILSKCDGWQVYQSQLANVGPDGKTAVRSGIEELIEAGYLERQKKRGEDGQFEGWEYIIHEDPVDPEATEMGFSAFGKGESGKGESGKADTTKKDTYQNEQNTKTEGREAHAHAHGDPEEKERLVPIPPESEGSVGERAAQMYHNTFPRRLTNLQKDKIRVSVHDLEAWSDTLELWAAEGWRNKKIHSMIDRYESIAKEQEKRDGIKGIHYLNEHQKQSDDWEMGEEVALLQGTPITELKSILRNQTTTEQFEELYEGD